MSRRFINNINFSSGNLSINSTSSNYAIGVYGNTSSASVYTNNTAGPGLIIGTTYNTEASISISNPNITAGSSTGFVFGSTNTTNGNCAEILFTIGASGSTTNTLSFGIQGKPKMYINGLGYMGIGASTNGSINYPLTVNNASSSFSYASSYVTYFNNAGAAGGYSGTLGPSNSAYYSIGADASIVSGQFELVSDIRVKKSIETLTKEYTRAVFNKINPVKFSYIDDIDTKLPTYGFIAQEVKDTVGYGVTTKSDFIPNIYTIATVGNLTTSGSQLLLNNLLHYNININDNLKLYDETEKQILVNITNVETSNNQTTITIDKTLDSDKIFVYGTKITDFCTLSKTPIFTIGIAGIKDVYERLQERKQRNLQQLEKLKSLKQRLSNVCVK